MTVTYLHDHTSVGKAQRAMYGKRKVKARDAYHPARDEPEEYDERNVSMSSNFRHIRAKNTGQLYKMDKEDWDLVKDIPWYEGTAGDLHTFQGQSFESYVGIVGLRKHPFAPRDKRRENYQGA